MKTPPEIRYARAENVSVAYSRWGQGDHLVVFTPPLVSNIELMWELPECRTGSCVTSIVGPNVDTVAGSGCLHLR